MHTLRLTLRACACALVGCTLVANSNVARAENEPRVFLLNAKLLAENRAKVMAGDKQLAPAIEKLKREADAALTEGPFSVVHKTATPPSGDKHDYMSYAPYWWPDPSKPDGLPYIVRDGERNPDVPKLSDRPALDQMVLDVETLAFAYYFTGDEKYAQHARTLLRAWFVEPATRMNPNVEYAQAVRGRDTGSGSALIESHILTRLVDAVGLLSESPAWTSDDDRELRKWFDQFLHWMRETPKGRDENSRKNNHGTYYDVQVVSYALYLDQPALARKVLEKARTKRLAAQIEPDGRQPFELTRTNSWGYSLANLRGLMKLATLGESAGVDLWQYKTEDGRSILAAVEYLAPFGLEQKKWPYEQLDGFSKDPCYPLFRQAAEKYPKATFCDHLKKLPLAPSDREKLLTAK